MPNGTAYSYAPSGLPYIPDVSLPRQLQPSLPQSYAPSYAPSGVSYIPDVQLPQQLKPPTLPDLPSYAPSGTLYIPDVQLPPAETYIAPEEQQGGYGPIEFFGDVAKGAVDLIGGAAGTLIDVGGEILSNLEVGVGTNLASYGYGYYQTYEQKKLAEKIMDAQRSAGYVVGVPGTKGLVPTTSIPAARAAGQPPGLFQTEEGAKMITYAIIALFAFLLLKGKK